MTITKKNIKWPAELGKPDVNYKVYACENDTQAEAICSIAESLRPNKPGFWMRTWILTDEDENMLVPDDYNDKGYSIAMVGYIDNDDYMNPLTYEFFTVT